MEIIAHRGVRKNREEENTVGAFNRAVFAGCRMMELDCRLTKDRKLVVNHDPFFVLSDKSRVYIYENTLEDLQTKVGAVIPVEFVLKFFIGAIKINVELKDTGSAAVLNQLLYKLLSKNAWTHGFIYKNIIVSSFILEELVEVRKCYPHLEIGLLRDWGVQGKFETKKKILESLKMYNFEAVHFSIARATHKTVKYFKEKGFRVRVYTINNSDLLKKYIEWGVDGIFTDKAEELIKAQKA